MKPLIIICWLLRITAAVILLQTLYLKFTRHPESVILFTKPGVEPLGRIGTGAFEPVTGILLLLPSIVFICTLFGMGLMKGAILSPLLVIGIESQGDVGELFMLAIAMLVYCHLLAILHKEDRIKLYESVFKKRILVH